MCKFARIDYLEKFNKLGNSDDRVLKACNCEDLLLGEVESEFFIDFIIYDQVYS